MKSCVRGLRMPAVFPLVATLVLAAGVARGQAPETSRIAAINLRRAVEGTSDFRRAAAQWTEAMTAQTAALSAKQQELRDAQEGLTAGEATFDETARSTLVIRIERIQREYDRMSAGVQQDLNQLREQLMLPITAKVDGAIREYAEENGIDLVLDIANPESALILADSTLDITDAIIAWIEDSAPGGEDVP